MRLILATGLIGAASPALAHIGHLGDLAGHGHWIGLGALGLAGLIGALAAKGGAKAKPPEPQDTDPEETPA